MYGQQYTKLPKGVVLEAESFSSCWSELSFNEIRETSIYIINIYIYIYII